jgi:hypothetical protein
MRPVPEYINAAWVDSLTDADILDIEARLHKRYSLIERRERKAQGDSYSLFRGSADLLKAWDRWSRISGATRARRLRIRRVARAS